jgi:hypothetical protein
MTALTVKPVGDGIWSVMERSMSRVAIAYFPRKWAALKHAIRVARQRGYRIDVLTKAGGCVATRRYEQRHDIESERVTFWRCGASMNTIGEMKDIYEIARFVGIPGNAITRFLKTAEMSGYVLVRKEDTHDAAERDSSKEKP